MSPFHLPARLSHPQVFLIPLATWTPEIIRQEDGPESFGLFTSYSIEYGALQFFGDNSYEYCGPMDLCEEFVEAATKADIVRYRRFVSKSSPWIIPLCTTNYARCRSCQTGLCQTENRGCTTTGSYGSPLSTSISGSSASTLNSTRTPSTTTSSQKMIRPEWVPWMCIQNMGFGSISEASLPLSHLSFRCPPLVYPSIFALPTLRRTPSCRIASSRTSSITCLVS